MIFKLLGIVFNFEHTYKVLIMSNLAVNTQKSVVNSFTEAGKIPSSNSRNQKFQNTLEQAIYPKIDASIDLKDKVQVFKAQQLTHEENVDLLQKSSGLSKEEAEKALDSTALINMIINGDALEKKAEAMATPEAINNVLKTMKVDVVARDSDGNMVAKLYKDGTFISSPKLQELITKAGADNLSGEEKMRFVERQSHIAITQYKNSSDFDLLKEAQSLRDKLAKNLQFDTSAFLLTV